MPGSLAVWPVPGMRCGMIMAVDLLRGAARALRCAAGGPPRAAGPAPRRRHPRARPTALARAAQRVGGARALTRIGWRTSVGMGHALHSTIYPL